MVPEKNEHEEKPVPADNDSAPWHFHPSEANSGPPHLRNALLNGKLLGSECAEEWTAAIVLFMKNLAGVTDNAEFLSGIAQTEWLSPIQAATAAAQLWNKAQLGGTLHGSKQYPVMKWLLDGQFWLYKRFKTAEQLERVAITISDSILCWGKGQNNNASEKMAAHFKEAIATCNTDNTTMADYRFMVNPGGKLDTKQANLEKAIDDYARGDPVAFDHLVLHMSGLSDVYDGNQSKPSVTLSANQRAAVRNWCEAVNSCVNSVQGIAGFGNEVLWDEPGFDAARDQITSIMDEYSIMRFPMAGTFAQLQKRKSQHFAGDYETRAFMAQQIWRLQQVLHFIAELHNASSHMTMAHVKDDNPGEFATRPQLTATDFKKGDAGEKVQEAFKRVRTMIASDDRRLSEQMLAHGTHEAEPQDGGDPITEATRAEARDAPILIDVAAVAEKVAKANRSFGLVVLFGILQMWTVE